MLYDFRAYTLEAMRVVDVDPDIHGTDALGGAVEKAKDANASPILLNFYGKHKESGCSWCVDCAEGIITFI